jgi:hypothetical protein
MKVLTIFSAVILATSVVAAPENEAGVQLEKRQVCE